MGFPPALCRADPVHRKQLSLVVIGDWRDRVVSESKKTKVGVKSGFSILKKAPKIAPRAAPGVAVNFARTWSWAWA